MPVKVNCETCNRTLRAPDEKIGKKVRCPHCKTVFVIRDPSAELSSATNVAISSAPQVSASWHVQSYDGNRYGPISKQELDQWAAGNSLTANCQVLQEGAQQWQWAHELYPQLGQTASGDAFDGARFDSNQLKPVASTSLTKHQQAYIDMNRLRLKIELKNGVQVVNEAGIYIENPKASNWRRVHEYVDMFGNEHDMGSSLSPNYFTVFEFTHPSGDFMLVSPYEQDWVLPHQFVAFVPGCLPHTIAFRRVDKVFAGGVWTAHDPNAPLVLAAKNRKALTKGVAFKIAMASHNEAIMKEMRWGIQAVPLGTTHFLLMICSGMRGLVPKFGIEWFIERRKEFADFIASQHFQGNSEPRFMFPTHSLPAIVSKLGPAVATGHPF